MAHSYTKCLYHCVFSTRERRTLIPREFEDHRWACLGGIARTNQFRALAVGGTACHAHAVRSLSATMPIATAVQLVKAGSSKWLHEHSPELCGFAWQEGYGAFSIGVSQVDDTSRYIARQAEHRRTQTFEGEYLAFLKECGIEYDERYVFG
jgi:REP element-mobilizing transposase RayT